MVLEGLTKKSMTDGKIVKKWEEQRRNRMKTKMMTIMMMTKGVCHGRYI